MIRVVCKTKPIENQLTNPDRFTIIDCTSHNNDPFWQKNLSPFYLGPVNCYDGIKAMNVENAWQFSKVFENQVDENGDPLPEWYTWRDKGFADRWAHRYPMGKGKKPLYNYFKVNGKFEKLGYIESRKKVYIPLYGEAFIKSPAYDRLKQMRDSGINIALADFDGYNNFKLGLSYEDAVNYAGKTLGHVFVIAMLLENTISEQDILKRDIKL